MTRVVPTMVRREHNNEAPKFRVDTDGKNTTPLSSARKEWLCASASNIVSLPPLWYQSHSFLAGDSVVVFSVSPSVSTRNFGAQLLCRLLTVVGATLVVK